MLSLILIGICSSAILLLLSSSSAFYLRKRAIKHRHTYRAESRLRGMPPTVHFVRHAQGYHNLNVANHQMRDPLLTPYGEQQCAHLKHTFPYLPHVDLVVASPLKRTIYTALKSFPDVIARRKLEIVTIPELQETSDLPCDTGSTVQELKREFAGQPVSFDLLDPSWYSKKGKWAAEARAIEARARVARKWLRDRPEMHIVAVTHGGMLHYITEDWQGMDKLQGTGWANTEFRSYVFDPASGDDASLVETDDSRLRRRGTEKPITEAERRNLEQTLGKSFKDSGVPHFGNDPAHITSKV